MDDPSSILPPSSPPPYGHGPSATTSEPMDPKEIEDGKVLAALCYPIWIIALVLLFVRNNSFSLYHAKQMMAMTIVHTIIALPLMCLFFCAAGGAGAFAPRGPGSSGGAGLAALPCMFLLVWGLVILLGIWAFAMMILGMVNAINGKAKPLPLYGIVADKLFTGLNKK